MKTTTNADNRGRNTDTSSSWLRCALLLGALSIVLASGCNKNRKPAPTPRQADTISIRDVPAPLRGTVGAEAQLRGVQSTLISGIGFVVGLNGTGGLTMPEQFAAHLEREMGLNGITASNTESGTGIAGKSPRQLLQDPNTAAVIVQAAIPPGSQVNDSFDIYVRAVNATSLEGGRLWTTPLRIGPPSAFGNTQARVLADASGPIFLNPFAEPGASEGVSREVGRVLEGGSVTFPTLIEIVLDNPSHQRVRQITSAINSSFPMRAGDSEPTARGKDETLIQVRVPVRYREKREDFVELIRHLTIDQTYPEVYARRYAAALESDAYLAGSMSWCLQALGERAKPFLADLYDAPEAAPRLAALRAGAGLDDPRAVGPLRDLATDGPDNLRTTAIALLGEIDGGPVIEQTLRDLLSSKQFAVRIEAYEALMQRAVSVQRRRIARSQGDKRAGERLSRSQVETLARTNIRGGNMFGVSRELVEGKFFLDRVPFGDPLIYITQQGEPRVVIFGDETELQTPLLVSAWSDRLLLAADSASDPIRLFYRDELRRRRITLESVPQDLEKFIRLLAREPNASDPVPGLGLSYAEIVGVLYELQVDGGTLATFTTENDRLLAELLQSSQDDEIEIRAEAPGGDITLVSADDPRQQVVNREQTGVVRERRTLLVPVNPPGGTEPDAPISEPTEDPDLSRPE